MASEKEEEYFARLEIERKKKLEIERQKIIAEEEKKRLKELHFMHCPKCGMDLKEIEYNKIKVDKCFNCEGIWLDNGELESLINLEKKSIDKILGIFKR